MRGATVPQEAAALRTNENHHQGVGGGSSGLGADSKSVIQQRIERLYGPAALAGGFFSVKSPSRTTGSSSGAYATTSPMKGCAILVHFFKKNDEFFLMILCFANSGCHCYTITTIMQTIIP